MRSNEKTPFKDHFSDKPGDYSVYRPGYPEEMFAWLSTLTKQHELAWDCGTGNGQAAVTLSNYYTTVIGTDASKNQINNAIPNNGVTYRVGRAENTAFKNNSIDLITVAQALHWFDIENFTEEVNRVLKPGGILSAWTYAVFDVTPDINKVIDQLYSTTISSYWAPERKHIEEGYKSIEIPLYEVFSPDFKMITNWNFSQFTGYLRTWSAVKRYTFDKGKNPVDKIQNELLNLWGPAQRKINIEWPLSILILR